MLEIEAMTVAAGSFRLRDINLVVTDGECHGVLGPSGSGKSTLLHAILGLLVPERGRILLEGTDVTHMPIERRGLGFVPQQLGLFPHLTVRENLAYSAWARGVPAAQFQPLVDKLVDATGIGGLLDRYPNSLSGGERQRAGLVRALSSQPRLVLLDEPFTALNESLRYELWRLLSELRREWQLTVLLVTHDLTEAFTLADRVTILMEGSVVQQGEKTDVYGRPNSLEVARFLGVETLCEGHIVGVSAGVASVRVGAAILSAPASSELADDVIVSIRGEEVTLEGKGGTTGSMHNRLIARVVSVQFGSPLLRVELDAGFPLLAYIARPVYEELALCPGSTVTAVIKVPGVHLIKPQTGLKRSGTTRDTVAEQEHACDQAARRQCRAFAISR